MPARERRKLTDGAVARLWPRDREYTVWDSRLPGLGVRVRPTGGKSWVMLRDAGGRSKRVSLGPVMAKTVDEARRECHARRADPEREETIPRSVPSPCSGTSSRVRGRRRISTGTSHRPNGRCGM